MESQDNLQASLVSHHVGSSYPISVTSLDSKYLCLLRILILGRKKCKGFLILHYVYRVVHVSAGSCRDQELQSPQSWGSGST